MLPAEGKLTRRWKIANLAAPLPLMFTINLAHSYCLDFLHFFGNLQNYIQGRIAITTALCL